MLQGAERQHGYASWETIEEHLRNLSRIYRSGPDYAEEQQETIPPHVVEELRMATRDSVRNFYQAESYLLVTLPLLTLRDLEMFYHGARVAFDGKHEPGGIFHGLGEYYVSRERRAIQMLTDRKRFNLEFIGSEAKS